MKESIILKEIFVSNFIVRDGMPISKERCEPSKSKIKLIIGGITYEYYYNRVLLRQLYNPDGQQRL